MDEKKLHETATALYHTIKLYAATDDDVCQFASAIKTLIEQAQNGKITRPMEFTDIPGGYYFTEGNLRKFADLERAFAEFRIELIGGEISLFKPPLLG